MKALMTEVLSSKIYSIINYLASKSKIKSEKVDHMIKMEFFMRTEQQVYGQTRNCFTYLKHIFILRLHLFCC